MGGVIEGEIGAVFLPVSNIEKSAEWYRELLGIKEKGEVLFGHIYSVPGTKLVLDSRIYPKRSTGTAPLFHFNTKDIEKAYEQCRGTADGN
ncbi:VOC family protein [Alteribacter natronophilus]|uniref:VOC family protein n=1 Tax=Alteribacter natronophilus TaxID=2583810 RepID=UPI00279599E0|nr:VOC family protein [Alteribacter natronophilus]